MNNNLSKLSAAEQFEYAQMTRVLSYWLQEALSDNEPAKMLYESLQPIADSNEFDDFDWDIIRTSLEEILDHRETVHSAASKAACQITGLSSAAQVE